MVELVMVLSVVFLKCAVVTYGDADHTPNDSSDTFDYK